MEENLALEEDCNPHKTPYGCSPFFSFLGELEAMGNSSNQVSKK